MKKLLGLLALGAMLFVGSCEKYDHAIADHDDRLGQLEESFIASVKQQITAIEKSLKNLEAVDKDLEEYIKSLEAEAAELQRQLDENLASDASDKKALEDKIAAVNLLLEELKAKDAELDKRLDELKKYADGEINAAKDWAESTFATLEHYSALQAEISAIKILIEEYKDEISSELKKSIGALEKSMMSWVNTFLADGYYDIAAIDAKLAALEQKLSDADADLADELEAQQAALEQAKTDLTKAYEKAIQDAIETNNGVISKTIAEELKKAMDKVDARLADIENDIASLQKNIEAINDKISSIEDQIKGINASLDDLKKADSDLQSLIEALETSSDKADGELLEQLKNQKEELEDLIEDLESYVDDQIKDTEDWVETTFATLEQYSALQTKISTIEALLEQHKSDLTDGYTGAIADAVKTIEDAIGALETSMKTWVNEVLADGYYDIAAIDAKLAALEKQLGEKDTELAAQIAAQQTALENAKAELKTAYENAIKDAIEENNGKLSKEIADAVKAALDQVDEKLAAINKTITDIQNELAAINIKIASIEEQIGNIIDSLDDLEGVDETLAGLIESLNDAAVDLQTQIDNNAAADAAAKKALEDELAAINNLITALQTEDESLAAKIADLKTYVDQVKSSVDKDIEDTKTWVSTTFATLEQYEEMQTTIATISALVDTYKADLSTGYTEAIATAVENMQAAITASKAAMQEWVSDYLAENYYDIAAIDAKLAALEKQLGEKDTELAAQIAAQQTALENAKAELKTAYENAIKDAIEENNGKITGDIATAVEAAEKRIDAKILAINAKIESIEARIKDLEDKVDDLVARIQSMRFIPEYSDGKVELGSGANTAELTFMVSPKDAAAGVAAAWANSNGVVTAFIKPTKPRTKASYDMEALAVTNVTGNANGTLVVTISAEDLSEDFWYEGIEANVFVCISDGNNDIISEMIPIYYVGAPYVTFKASAVQTLKIDTEVDGLQFSTDKGATWHSLTTSTDNATFGPDNDLLLRGINSRGTDNATISFTEGSVPVACSGDIRTLVDYRNYANVDTGSAKFMSLFYGCTNLTTAPELPATTLLTNCYSNMFKGCTGLTSAPELPATQLAVSCYSNMFSGCTGLTSAPELPATQLAVSCYSNMFSGCTGLTSAPELPATTLAKDCYYSMFNGCTGLTTAPALPATKLEVTCYKSMFYGCIGLTTAPELPATRLSETCYSFMFYGCTGLTSAPVLPAATLTTGCYQAMFYGCSSLNEITMLATNVSASRCLNEWVSGVAATGTFTKVAEVTLTTGVSGIPAGWTVIQEASKGADAPDFGFGGNFSN